MFAKLANMILHGVRAFDEEMRDDAHITQKGNEQGFITDQEHGDSNPSELSSRH